MEIPELVKLWYLTWLTLTPTQHLASVLAGIFGACIHLAWRGAPIRLPRIDKKKGEIELNFIATIVMGAGAAFVLDVGIPVSVMAGILAPALITLASKLIIRSAYAIVHTSGMEDIGGGKDDGPAN